MLRRANGYSFPSGHAMGSAVAFGALAYLAFRAIRELAGESGGDGVSLHARRLPSPSPASTSASTGFRTSLAGVTVGTVWVTTTTVAYETLRRIRRLRGTPKSTLAGQTHRSQTCDSLRSRRDWTASSVLVSSDDEDQPATAALAHRRARRCRSPYSSRTSAPIVW